jgi:hypothetical protein
MLLARRMRFVAIASLLAGCANDSGGVSSPQPGTYSAELTSIVTVLQVDSIGSEVEDCGPPQAPNRVRSREYRVRKTANGAYEVRVGDGGCLLTATAQGTSFNADEEACRFEPGSPLVGLGVRQTVYRTFSLEPLARTISSSWVTYTDTSSGLVRSCGVVQGRIQETSE